MTTPEQKERERQNSAEEFEKWLLEPQLTSKEREFADAVAGSFTERRMAAAWLASQENTLGRVRDMVVGLRDHAAEEASHFNKHREYWEGKRYACDELLAAIEREFPSATPPATTEGDGRDDDRPRNH